MKMFIFSCTVLFVRSCTRYFLDRLDEEFKLNLFGRSPKSQVCLCLFLSVTVIYKACFVVASNNLFVLVILF